jgi:MSHA biogenesis protein MshK
VCAVLAHAAARAQQALVDPMRPAEARSDAGAVALQPATSLQGVVTSPQRKLALINGAIVPMGGAIGDGRLVDVTESSALLKKDGRIEVLRMYPRIERKQLKRPSADKEP